MKINQFIYSALVLALLALAGTLSSCKKKTEGGLKLTLTASTLFAETEQSVTFEVKANGKTTTDAIVYINEKAINGLSHAFEEEGVYQIYAKKGESQSEAIEIEVTEADLTYDVYVAGFESNGTKDVAKYWKNRQETLLSDGTTNASALSIKVEDDVIFVGGFVTDFSPKAAYWVNDEVTFLTNGDSNAYINSIQVFGDNIYVAGQENEGATGFGKYWKNDNPVTLPNSTKINAMHVIDDEQVYTAGYEYDVTTNKTIVKYWKNDVAVPLTDGSKAGNANAIYVDGDNVYVAGNEGLATGFNTTAVYWLNGQITQISDVTKSANAYSIFIYEGDIYVAGRESNGTVNVAKFWKNGKETLLSDGQFNASATSIYVIDGDVFVAGTEFDGTKNLAKYWKNGKAITLGKGTNSSGATSIYVQKKK